MKIALNKGWRFLGTCLANIPAMVAVLLFPIPGYGQTLPELPRVYLETRYALPTAGRTITVNAGGDLQAALNSANPGDVIVLQAGTTFTGNFTLPNKTTGSGWIYIQSSACSQLPPPGTRVSPAQAYLMPKIVSPNTDPALTTATSAHHYRLVGLEITTTHATTNSTHSTPVNFSAPNRPTTLSQLPSDLTVDRCYIHGTPTGNIRRGIALNSARTAIIDSYLSNCHEVSADSQAIAGWDGPGPYKIVNNYLEGAGENVMFGGADPSISNLVPSDIEIRHNYFFKPLTWKIDHPSYAGTPWSIKNLFELKNARRVLVEGNIFEQCWPHAQSGFAIVLTVRNQDNTAPWSTVEDVTFRRNLIRNSTSGLSMHGRDDPYVSQQTQRVLIEDNLFVQDAQLSGVPWRMLQVVGRHGDAVTFSHNTLIPNESQVGPNDCCTALMVFGDDTNEKWTSFVFQNNIGTHLQYGIFGSGTGEGTAALNAYLAAGYGFAKNLIAGSNPAGYPANNFYPSTLTDVGFVDLAGGNYRLSATSPYKGQATDGKDIGADIDALTLATAGVINGTTHAPSPPRNLRK